MQSEDATIIQTAGLYLKLCCYLISVESLVGVFNILHVVFIKSICLE
jgi:hypothetical protein